MINDWLQFETTNKKSKKLRSNVTANDEKGLLLEKIDRINCLVSRAILNFNPIHTFHKTFRIQYRSIWKHWKKLVSFVNYPIIRVLIYIAVIAERYKRAMEIACLHEKKKKNPRRERVFLISANIVSLDRRFSVIRFQYIIKFLLDRIKRERDVQSDVLHFSFEEERKERRAVIIVQTCKPPAKKREKTLRRDH